MNVSPGTAELIWRHKGVILHQGELAAQKLTATVLFMDIRGFTSIAETLPSQQLLPWLNQYFETMTDCIMKHGGMVDKYIGDAIMAVFGAPLPRTDPADIRADAIAALQASLEMHERLRSLNQQLSAQQLPTIEFGIGIHTGPLIGGTVGNRHRINYSLFGDTVNIAARLETMTKALPATAPYKLLISADTCGYAQAQFPVELFQSGPLRGRAGHTEVYTIRDVAIADSRVENSPIANSPASTVAISPFTNACEQYVS
jgi:class 3 adenylate cyclase